MEIFQKQLPLLPPGWTLARALKYVAKVVVFVIVPGLHQIVSRRRILGWLMMLIFITAQVTHSFLPWDPRSNFIEHALAENLSATVQGISLLLLVLDFKWLESRKLDFRPFPVLSVMAAIYFMPVHDAGFLSVIVENKNNLCPEICRNDVIEFDLINYRQDKINANDLVVINWHFREPYITRILETPSEEFCQANRRSPRYLPLSALVCRKNLEDDPYPYPYPYLVLGGPQPELRNSEGQPVSKIQDSVIQGVRLRKIGNLHEYFFHSGGMTESLGYTLLTIYNLTGINLFGLSEH
jgi:hypothetical protein